MFARIARIIVAKELLKKDMRLCPLCSDTIIHVGETACLHCTLDASFGLELVR